MRHIVRTVPLVVCVAAALLVASPSTGQTLDQRAFDAVWDRLETLASVKHNSDTERVHVLRQPASATWLDGKTQGLRELQRLAGAIPDDTFRIDPSVRMRLLHQVYAAFVADVDLPKIDPEQRKALQQASAEYRKAFNAAEQRLEEFNKAWERHVADLDRRKEEVTTLAKLEFLQSKAGYFDSEQTALDAATTEVQRFRPVAAAWVQAVGTLTGTMNSALRTDLAGLWLYEGSFATLKSLNTCADDGPGWTGLTFDSSVKSEHTRTGSWNVGGGWAGSFFAIDGSGKGDEYSKVITGSGDAISVKFCNMQYLPVRPGMWFDIGLLEAIDSGLLSLKSNSPNKRQILGPKGAIPRMVKGLIVARSMRIEAKLSTSRDEEYRRNISGTSGVRIGPWSVGGGGGGTEFRHESRSATGAYVRSTDTTVPVIIAVVTESTR
jgi:hypothetical protein